tara:strand:- start:1084 stop:1611 length:528 start_codon:yes stop_codon:yes gene_type:complete
MANVKLTDKTSLAQQTASGDQFMVVDVSDNTGSTAGTSKKVSAKYIIQTDIVTGNLDLNSNPLTLVAAPGSGYIVQPLTITVLYTYNSVASTTVNFLYISYDSSSTTEYLARQRDFIRSDSADRSYQFGASDVNPSDGVYAGSIDNKALVMYTNADLGGNGSFKVYITYQIVKIS